MSSIQIVCFIIGFLTSFVSLIVIVGLCFSAVREKKWKLAVATFIIGSLISIGTGIFIMLIPSLFFA